MDAVLEAAALAVLLVDSCVIDQFSRRVNGFALFTEAPSSVEVCQFLDRVAARTGSRPKHVITDKGRQFFCETFKAWCRDQGIRPRFGAVGRKGSIAIVERFFRSMKAECRRRILVPLGLDPMREELACYATWYNLHRPHQALGGLTPAEERVHVVVKFMDARRQLPIVDLKRVA